MFVAVANVMQFIDRLTDKVNFFISYEVKHEMMTAKMTMDAGKIVVDAKTLFGKDSVITNGKCEGE